MHPALLREIETALGAAPEQTRYLASGNKASIYALRMQDGTELIAKLAENAAPDMLPTEGWMLQYLAEHSQLPVPQVYLATERLLVMQYVPHDKRSQIPQIELAETLALLHGNQSLFYGLECPTFIGSLKQPNPQESNWVTFFAQHRLRYMARQALEEKRIPSSLMHHIDRLAVELPNLLSGSVPPVLVHGDLWQGNILCANGQICGFIDPAIYYADPEIELAFGTLFGTLTDEFFDCYQAIRPLSRDFFEVRRDIYNLYPLLVHVRLFGGSYVTSVERIVSRFVR